MGSFLIPNESMMFRRFSELFKQCASRTVHYIMDLPHALVLRNMITIIYPHTYKNEGKNCYNHIYW